jgi:hypothetical protein
LFKSLISRIKLTAMKKSYVQEAEPCETPPQALAFDASALDSPLSIFSRARIDLTSTLAPGYLNSGAEKNLSRWRALARTTTTERFSSMAAIATEAPESSNNMRRST